jgi:hypothetical protein
VGCFEKKYFVWLEFYEFLTRIGQVLEILKVDVMGFLQVLPLLEG